MKIPIWLRPEKIGSELITPDAAISRFLDRYGHLSRDCPASVSTPCGYCPLRPADGCSECLLAAIDFNGQGHCGLNSWIDMLSTHNHEFNSANLAKSSSTTMAAFAHDAHMRDPSFWGRLVSAWEARYGTDWVQEDMARELKVHQTMVSQWKKGALPRMQKAKEVAETLRVCVEWLLTGRGPRVPGKSLSEIQNEAAARIAALPPDHQQKVLEMLRLLEPSTTPKASRLPAPKNRM